MFRIYGLRGVCVTAALACALFACSGKGETDDADDLGNADGDDQGGDDGGLDGSVDSSNDGQPEPDGTEPDATDADDVTRPDAVELDDGLVNLEVAEIELLVSSIAGPFGDRPVFGIQLEGLPAAHFVLNELFVTYTDPFVLKTWAGDIGAQIQDEQVLAEYTDGAQVGYFARLVLLDPTGTAADFGVAVAELGPTAEVTMRVSSAEAGDFLGTAARIAADAREADNGIVVGLNAVNIRGGFIEGTTSEASPASPPAGYTSDAYQWPNMRPENGSYGGIGAAWTLMANRRLFANRVKIAIIDGGFAGAHPDYPAPQTFVSAAYGVSEVRDVSNLSSCTGGAPCPWHGTGAALAAFGLPDNGFGAAGPAGPVAEPLMIYLGDDSFSVVRALYVAAIESADIVNMSFSATYPWPVAWSNVPDELATNIASASRILFASAGNDTRDIDSTVCVGALCWEEVIEAPCENVGVQCVGSTFLDAAVPATFSNFGSRNDGNSIDFWTIGFVYVGMSGSAGGLMPPTGSDDPVSIYSGTSASSPHAAGMAALLWAADPSLTINEVLETLRTTSVDPEAPEVYNFLRIDRAVGSVIPAEGVNLAPAVSITGLATVEAGNELLFQASATDPEDGEDCCTIEWTVSGTTASVEIMEATDEYARVRYYLPGTYSVAAVARDSEGRPSELTRHFVRVTVPPDLTSVSIVSPVPAESYPVGTVLQLRGYGTDEIGNRFPCESLSWTVTYTVGATSVEDGPLVGCEVEYTLMTAATATIKLEASTGGGLRPSRTTAPFNVINAPVPTIATATIRTPVAGYTINSPFERIAYEAVLTNPDETPLYVGWRAQWRSPRGDTVYAEIERNALRGEWRPADSGVACTSEFNVDIEIELVIETEVDTYVVDRTSVIVGCTPG